MYRIALHEITFIYSIMHIYWGYVYPLKLQLTTQLWNNVTPNTVTHITECTYTGDTYTSQSHWQYIYEILLQHTSVTYTRMYKYQGYIYPPKFWLTTHLWNNVTPNKLHISQNAHIMRYMYPPLQMTIHLWNTITPHKCHL